MDISFTCDKCGKNLVIDNAGAGITIDCPECGKAVYVPSTAPPPKPKDPPARVEPKPLNRMATPTPPPAPVPAPRPVIPSLLRPPRAVCCAATANLPSSTRNQKPAVHPSIEGGVHCLVILVAIEMVGLFVSRQNFQLGVALFYASTPFLIAPLLCAVYGMCMGHVRQGLLVLAGLALIVSLSYWIAVSMAMLVGADAQRQLMQQMQGLPNGFPFPTSHP